MTPIVKEIMYASQRLLQYRSMQPQELVMHRQRILMEKYIRMYVRILILVLHRRILIFVMAMIQYLLLLVELV
jgi:hypothetical protein